MCTKNHEEELKEQFHTIFSTTADQRSIAPYLLYRFFPVSIMGYASPWFSGQYMGVLQQHKIYLLFKPHSRSSIDCYYLENKELYQYHFYHFSQPEPENKEQWQYQVWQLLYSWHKKYQKFQGMSVLLSTKLPYEDDFGTSLAIQLIFFQFLQIYIEENPLWLHLSRRSDQLELIHFAQEMLSSAENRLSYHLDVLYGMVLHNNQTKYILYTNQKTLEPKFLEWKISDHHLWVIHFQGLGQNLRLLYDERVRELEQAGLLLQALGLSKDSLHGLTHALLQSYQADIPQVLFERLRFLIFENMRVFELVQAMESGDLSQIIAIFHESQRELLEHYAYDFDLLHDIFAFLQQFPIVKAIRLSSKMSGTFVLIIQEDPSSIEAFFHQLAHRYPVGASVSLINYHKIIL